MWRESRGVRGTLGARAARMANYNPNGRNAGSSDDYRSSWRSQDERGRWRDRDDEDRYASERRSLRGSYDDDRDEGYRSVERYGQGQSGTMGGRYGEDRSSGMQGRNQNYGAGYEDRPYGGMGLDDRFAGRGGASWSGGREGYGRQEEGLGQRGYGGGEYRSSGPSGYDGRPHQGYGYATEQPASRGNERGTSDDTYGRYGRSGEGWGPQGPAAGYTGGYSTAPGGRQGQPGREGGGEHTRYGVPGGQPGGGTWGYGGEQRGMYRGKGPVGYQRSDERIRENVCEALTDDEHVDASHIEVTVKNGDVTLAGTVSERRMKRLAEDVVERVSGVKDVQNQLRVVSDTQRPGNPGSTSGVSKSETEGQGDKRGRS